MEFLDKNSLFKTVDNVSEALLFDLRIDSDETIEIADFIVNQQGKPHAYANTFAPTETDLKNDLVLFTGEKITTGAGKCHMIGEEASRILRKFELQSDKIKLALHKADIGLKTRINEGLHNSRYDYGMYCCKSCSCALWLNLASGGLKNDSKLLNAGLACLKKHRDDEGRWNGFLYYYTLNVLNEVDKALVMDEMRYAAKSIERRIKKKKTNEGKYEMRRNYICEQILNKVNSN
jgi:hypothetical protein